MKEFSKQCLGDCVSTLLFEDAAIVQEAVLVNTLQSVQFFKVVLLTLLIFIQLTLPIISTRTLDKTQPLRHSASIKLISLYFCL